MATVDDKVVAMSFESSKFESGVSAVLSSIDKLKKALVFPDAGKGLEQVNKAAQGVDLSHIGSAVDGIKAKLGAFQVAALAIFANVAQKAVSAGAQFASAFTLDPIKAGFAEYSTNLNAIQTILANTQASGATLEDVNSHLLDLNKYSDQTIYNFSQMAKNIGTFTAAGVDLDTATGAIKGIANLAALSGSNADQASTAMYQLSQAISAGKVGLQDWNSVVNAGMGGTVFQRALATTAVAMGKLKDSSLKLKGPMKNVAIDGESFRQSIQAGPGKTSWLTSDVLTATLKQFTGDLSAAQLKAQGFNDAQIKSIQQTAKTAKHAATEVKTISQVFDVAKETAGSGWSQTFQIIFGNFGEAKKTFTALSNTINGFINKNAQARNKVLGDWKALSGRTILIDSIKTAFHNLGLILKPIQKAFRDIFPPKTGKDLLDLTKRFQSFAEALKPSPKTIDNLRRTFRGLFALLDIGKTLIGDVFKIFGKLFGAVGVGQGGFLDFTAKIGDFLVALDKAIKSGKGFSDLFVKMGVNLTIPLKIFKAIGDAIGNLLSWFSGFSPGGFSGGMDKATKASIPFQKVLETIVDMIENLGPAISNAISGMNFNAILAVIRTGLFGALVVMAKQFFGKGTLVDQLGKGFGKGILGNISESFGALTGSLKAMQANIKANTLKQIAIAIGILALSIVALSFVDPDKLKSAIGAITVVFGELLGAMAIIDKIGKSGGFIKMPFIAGSMILLAGAIDILAIAVIALSRLSWEELLKGLVGVGGLLVGISLAVGPLSAGSGGLVRAGIGLMAIAVAMNIMAKAVAAFGSLSLSELAKGLGGIAIGLNLMIDAIRAMPTKEVMARGFALLVVAAALKIMASAIAQIGQLSLTAIVKGLAGITGALFLLSEAMHDMPQDLAAKGAGLLLVAIALKVMASAIQTMGRMTFETMAKGLGSLAIALGLLSIALDGMVEALPGAAALAVAAVGISLLAPALVKLGRQGWGNIIKGMISLAGAIAILGGAALLLAPVAPAMLALGAGLLLIGGGLALAGAGIALIGIGLSSIAVAGPAAIGILLQALVQFTEALGQMGINLVNGLLQTVEQLAKTAPKFVDALLKIIDSLLNAIIKSMPKVVKAFEAIVDAILKVLGDKQAPLIQAGLDLLIALLKGIRDNIGQITTLVADIIVKFLNSLNTNLNRIITAGTSLLLSFLKGIVSNLARVEIVVGEIVTKFIGVVATNATKLATAGLDALTKFLNGIANHLPNAIAAGAKVIVKFIEGLGSVGQKIIKAGTDTMIKFVNALGSNSNRLINAGAKALLKFLNGFADSIDKYEPQIIKAGFRIGVAIVTGIPKGMAAEAVAVYDKAKEIAKKAKHYITHPWEALSPSKVMVELGKNIMLGFSQGLDANAKNVYSSAEAVSTQTIGTFNDIFKTKSPSKVMYDMGIFVTRGLANGIKQGSKQDLSNVLEELNKRLLDQMKTSRETISSESDKLVKLLEARHQDLGAIAKSQKIIAQNQDLLDRSTAAHKALNEQLHGEKAILLDLVNEYDKLGDRLKKARDVLASAKQARADAIKSFTEQYTTLPDISTGDGMGTPGDRVKAYEDALKKQTAAVKKYHQTLSALRKLGLDDATYRKLLSEGTVDQAFASNLLAGGKDAVTHLNTLDKNLQRAGKSFGTSAGINLYQAGVDAAQGLVNGLKAKRKDLRLVMETIAADMVGTIKKQLKIKSPSAIFFDIGKDSMSGLAKGFDDSTKAVTDSIDNIATEAVSTMRDSLRGYSDPISLGIDTDPVITPIFDLSVLESQAGDLDKLKQGSPIPIAIVSGQHASAISSTRHDPYDGHTTAAIGGTTITYEQNNYSPKALDPIEIYRRTNSQLAQLKSMAHGPVEG